ncbi:DUF6894 family protein [Methylobacterium sp. A54F]
MIDTDDGDMMVAGNDEAAFDCPHKARAAAHEALGHMVWDTLPDGEERVFRAIVRDEKGREIYAASLTLAGRWTVPVPI